MRNALIVRADPCPKTGFHPGSSPGQAFSGEHAPKNSGAAEGHSTAPYSTGPGWGPRGRPGPGRRKQGRAVTPVARVRSADGGDDCRRDAPNLCIPRPHSSGRVDQPRPSGTARNRVFSPDLTRNRIVRLPPERASAKALRTSSGLATRLPAISRITSPVRKPCVAAGPSGSTCVTTTPSLPAPATLPAGASERPRRGTSVPLLSFPSGVARAWRCSRGSSPSVTLRVFSAPLLTTPSLTLEPGGRLEIFLARSRASLISWPFTEVITSPDWMPAFTAGPSACGSATSAPSAFLRPRLSAMSALTGWICTPIHPRVTAPLSLSLVTTDFTGSEGIANAMPTEPPEGE